MDNSGQMRTMKQRDAQWKSSLVNALKNLAEMRQASVSATTLVLYAGRLSEWELADLLPVIDEIALRNRRDGETAFPSLADIVERLRARITQMRSEKRTRAILEEIDKSFWEAVDYQKELTGETEQEVLDQINTPGFTGRRARQER